MKAISTRTKRWTTAMFAGLLVVGVATIGQAADGGTVDGNPKCEGFDFGWKAENPSGTYVIDRDGLQLTLTVGTYPQEGVAEPNHDNAVLTYAVDPSSDVQSGQIIVKGGPAANVYAFDASTPLHAPAVPSGKWPTISHVQVCWDEPDEPEPEYGAIELTKAVTGDDAPDDVDFELCITGPAPDTTTDCATVGAGETATFDNLEPGDYTVTETDPGVDWTVTYSATTLTVTADQTATGTVTNTWETEEPEPEYGAIELTKAVTGDDAPDDVDFELCITGPAPDTTTGCATVGAGETATFDNLEPGDYTVTETDPGVDWTVTYSATTLTVTADQTATGTVTNTWETEEPEPEYGAIELTKAVTGDDAPDDVDFELCITGPAPDTTTDCATVGAGETATFDNLEPGGYTVTETDPGVDWTVTYSATTLTVTADQTATGTVTNTWETEEPEPPVEPEYGTVVLTKAVTGTGAPANAVFGLCITGPSAGDTPECQLVNAGQTATFDSLEPGVYAVTETDPGTGWKVTYSTATLTVVADQTATATVTNTWETQEQLGPTPTTTVVAPSGGAVTTQPQSDALPVTGGDGGLALTQAGVAAGVLAAGTILMRLSRRPERSTG